MMKFFLVAATSLLSIAINAQTGNSKSAKDYIKQREQTDKNMNTVKRAQFKKSDSIRLITQKEVAVQPAKNKKKL
ncbi:hypothetical protein [Niabella hibiscisoli]|uniref:hypothetical protein n=1 Tax=Niabella hibiscisoli TaxID=1825928 RepID=UPI001F0E65E7|nr:hypothetical protein [Niabella hibiscisoli]MCH5720456.1 hypothetical protein [Niabella hibiscisoli]